MDSNYINKSRDSYDNQICDDLSEVILQYLSLEDKLRLECVSQQFRRTVTEKHYFLDITYKMTKLRERKSIEKFVKKFPKLSEIEFSGIIKTKLNPLLVETLTNNRNNWNKIEFNYHMPYLNDNNGKLTS